MQKDIAGKFKLTKPLPNHAKEMKHLEQVGQDIRNYDAYIAKELKAAQKRYFNENPSKKKVLGYSFTGRAYVKRPGSHAIKPMILDKLIMDGGLVKTKTAILKDVRLALPEQSDYVHDSVWYQQLRPSVWAKLQKAINDSKTPVSIKGCKTLDAVRDHLIAASIKNSANFSKKVTINIDEQNVVIGKNTYHIVANSSKGTGYPCIRIKRDGRQQSLNVNVLKMFLQQK